MSKEVYDLDISKFIDVMGQFIVLLEDKFELSVRGMVIALR